MKAQLLFRIRKRQSTMAAADFFKELCGEVICPICLECFQDPMMLDCGHNYCRACLTQFWDVSNAETSCPVCQERIPEKRNFRPNRLLANMIEIIKKIEVEEKEEGESVALCQSHHEPLKLFCMDDEAPICVVCDRSKEHKDHNIVPAEEAVSEYKGKIQEQQKSLEKEREILVNQKLSEEQQNQKWQKLLGEEEQKIKSAFEKAHEFLKKTECLQLAQLENLKNEMENRQVANSARLSVEILLLGNKITEMEEKCQQPQSEFLQDIRNTLKRYEKESVSHVMHQSPWLEERLRKHLKQNSALQNTMEKFTETLEQVLNTECLKQGVHKVNVILDPATAHPDLILSEELKSVRWEGIKQDLPENPERFDVMWSVLGQERFTSGKHCWEVEVEGRIWETWSSLVASEAMWAVGVARESVTRKGELNHYPNEGIWAVGKPVSDSFSSCQFWAYTSPGWTPLAVSYGLQKIRVLLDYDNGQVDFFDSDTNCLIFSFISESFLREAIRPYFWLNRGVRMKC